jgi:hypothetical protein
MTGRAAGYCAGYPVPGFANPAPGRGFGMGFGRGRGGGARGRGGGRGRRNRFYATGLPGWARGFAAAGPYGYAMPPYAPDPAVEKQMLQGHIEALKAELESVQRRLSELEKEDKEE